MVISRCLTQPQGRGGSSVFAAWMNKVREEKNHLCVCTYKLSVTTKERRLSRKRCAGCLFDLTVASALRRRL